MAAFPAHLIHSVEKYGSTTNSNDFEYICMELCQKLVSNGPLKRKSLLVRSVEIFFLTGIDNVSVEKSICSQVYWNAAAGVLVEAARRGLSVAALEELLPKNKFSEAIISSFKVHTGHNYVRRTCRHGLTPSFPPPPSLCYAGG